MELKYELVKIEDDLIFNGEKVKELKITELSFAGKLRIQGKGDMNIADVCNECVYPKGILEVMGTELTTKYMSPILQAINKVNGWMKEDSPIEQNGVGN